MNKTGIWNPKIIKLGENEFQVGLSYDDKFTYGVVIEQESTNKSILFTLDGLLANQGGVANTLRVVGFSLKHTNTFNKLFREWLKTIEPWGRGIVTAYEIKKEEERKWKKLKSQYKGN